MPISRYLVLLTKENGMNTRRLFSLLLSLVSLAGLFSVVAGCGKKEEPQPPGYYNGPQEAKGGGGGAAKGSGKMNVQ